MKKPKVIFTNSELQTAKDCSEKWRLRYGIGYRTRYLNLTQLRGKLIHILLDSHYAGIPWGEACTAAGNYAAAASVRLSDEDKVDVFTLLIKCEKIVGRYREHYRPLSDWSLDSIAVDPITKTPLIEAEFMTPIYTPNGKASKILMLTGKIDLIIKDPVEENACWICDHKTRETIKDSAADRMKLDQQLRLYAWGAQMYWGFKVKGSIYNLVKSDLPDDPKVNKNGIPSLAKCDTTVDALIACLIRQDEIICGMSPAERKAQKLSKEGVDFDAYAPEIQRLSRIHWFKRFYQEYSDADLSKVQLEIYQIALETHQRRFFPMNDAACDHWGGCEYRSICMGLSPEDTFTLAEKKHDEVSMDMTKFHAPLGKPYVVEVSDHYRLGMQSMIDQVNVITI